MSIHKVVEAFPAVPRRFTRRIGDVVQEGSNNSIIILGTDRTKVPEKPRTASPATIDDGLGTIEADGGGAGTGCVLLSVGRKDPNGDPDLFSDDSYIYLAMKTEVDKNLGTEDVVADAGVAPGILAKSSNVRVVFRDSLKISLENQERNDFLYMDSDLTMLSLNKDLDIIMEKDVVTIDAGKENQIVIDRASGKIDVRSKNEVNVFTQTAYVQAGVKTTVKSPDVTVNCDKMLVTGATTIANTLHVTDDVIMDKNLKVGIKTETPVMAVGQIVKGPAGPGSTSEIAGTLKVDTDVQGGGKSLVSHVHGVPSAKVGPDTLGTTPPT